ncbi:MAG: hypothetical protein WAN93_06770 [Solirubrobacteraceae bacterium]
MGLLDDAIREHLELKRLSGADPGVVAREEHDALGPVRRREEHNAREDGDAKSPDADGSFLSDSDLALAADSSAVGQETVEINMEDELKAGANFGRDSQTEDPEPAAPVPYSANTQPSTEDSLEWEVPGEPTDGSNLDDEEDPQLEEGREPIEDVLEETPDFLRDTPEQERLWFEQRPPRDFDFNE